MTIHEKIASELEDLTPEQVEVLSIRAALRLLPALARSQSRARPFAVWSSDLGARHLLSVFRYLQTALVSNLVDVGDAAGRSVMLASAAAFDAANAVAPVLDAEASLQAARRGSVDAAERSKALERDAEALIARANRVTAARSEIERARIAKVRADEARAAAFHAAAAVTTASRVFADACAVVGSAPLSYPIDAARTLNSIVRAIAVKGAAGLTAVQTADALSESLADALIGDLRQIRPVASSALLRLLEMNPQGISYSQLLAAPLWRAAMPGVFRELWMDFQKDAQQLESGFEVWIDWYRGRLLGEPIDVAGDRKWAALTPERLSQTPAEINAHLKAIRGSVVEKLLNRVRAIFIGFGGSGKTSVIKALHGEDVFEGQSAATEGIDIQDSKIEERAGVFTRITALNERDLTVHFWDFGGQVMVHATHQFFLRSNCLYIVVLESRADRNANEEAEYWLEHVKAFGGNAPTMIVGNKADNPDRVHLDIKDLKQKYPNIIDFFPVSCTEAKGRYKPEFDRFRRDFLQALTDAGVRTEHFTEPQYAVLKTVQEKAETDDFLSHDAFDEICADKEIPAEGPAGRDSLLDLFDKLGIVMHFPRLPFLTQFVLNPRWLTFGVYAIMFSRIATEARGRITESEVVRVLQKSKLRHVDGRPLRYPADRCELIVNTMVAFRVAYRLARDNSRLVIPALLEDSQPEHKITIEGSIAYRIAFKGFLPRQVLPMLIVDHHDDIIVDGEVEVVWANGVGLRPKRSLDAETLIKADYHARTLNVYVKGSDANAYVGIVRDSILRTLDMMPELEFEEQLLLHPHMRVEGPRAARLGEHPFWMPYSLIRTAQRQRLPVLPGADNQLYDVEKIGEAMPLRRDWRPADVFISYSHGDRRMAEQLCNELERSGVSVWFDRDLVGGQRFRSVIVQRIESAKAVIAIWTVNSIHAKWVIDEAARGDGENKLICLVDPLLEVARIPAPFSTNDHVLKMGQHDELLVALERLNVGRR